MALLVIHCDHWRSRGTGGGTSARQSLTVSVEPVRIVLVQVDVVVGQQRCQAAERRLQVVVVRALPRRGVVPAGSAPRLVLVLVLFPVSIQEVVQIPAFLPQ